MGKMKYRHELKYYIHYQDYLGLQIKLKQFMDVDKNADERGNYYVRSLYLDDMKNSALFDKGAGVRNRKKYRIRIYNQSDELIMLEKKIKNCHLTSKIRQSISKEVYQQILKGDFSTFISSDKLLLRELSIYNKMNLLKPVVIVDYEREAYIAEAGNVRVTFDKRLKTGLTATNLFQEDLILLKALDQDYIILEIKYDEYLPEYIKNVVQVKNLTKQAVSKYAICRKYTKLNSWEDN